MDEDYKLLVAAIDFGSTTAGYAFSFRHEYRKDPLDISTFLWTTGNHDIATSKAPCSVLLDLEKRFIAFGYEAEDKYEGILANNLQDDWYYFKGFKMLLYNAIENGEDIARDFKIDDVGGKSMSARRIFSIAIGYLRRHLLIQLRERNVGLHESEIWWTITVPSIWTEPAKEFMMQCAEKAGLDRQKVSILFEPEAASIYCRLLPVDKFIGHNKVTSFKSFEAGRKYIVVDAGGGTVNISTQEVSRGEEIDMLYKVSGGPWGGDKINEEFMKLLCNVFGDDIIQQFRDFNGPDYLDLTRQFELKKKTYNRFLKNDIVMRLPFELCDLFETYTGRKIEDAICKSKYSGKIKFKKSKLCLSPEVFEDLYADIVLNVTQEIGKILNHPRCKDVSAILMVGGFSESEILQLEIKNAFPDLQFFIPMEGGLAVLKGAVIFGHNPRTFGTRLCNFTYGVNAMLPYSKRRHPESHRVIWNGKPYCSNIFRVLFIVNEEIKEGEVRSIRVIDAFETEEAQEKRLSPIRVQIFASDEEDPVYTTDEGCRLHAEIVVSPPDGKWPRRVFGTVQLEFAGTEMIGTYISDDTGAKTCARFEYLPSVSTSRASSARSRRDSLRSKGIVENHFTSKATLRTIQEEDTYSRRSRKSTDKKQMGSSVSLDTISDDQSFKGSLMLNRGNLYKHNSRTSIYSDNEGKGSTASLRKLAASSTSINTTDSDNDDIKIEVD
ncbi:Hypothetical predicted protein [Mytilus galloprovincialis]|uniref:Uncharacterized protein n=1 Tax=Mytilus galloprovincialis TaxID=29158 RepID=A0A8B6GG36_MYTGA|nr:Hypothetical predicted protein [Mytilus galloprovincialis]